MKNSKRTSYSVIVGELNRLIEKQDVSYIYKSYKSKKHWESKAKELEDTLAKLESRNHRKDSIKKLLNNLMVGFSNINLYPVHDKDGYLKNTSLTKTETEAQLQDWEKVGAHLMLSAQKYQSN